MMQTKKQSSIFAILGAVGFILMVVARMVPILSAIRYGHTLNLSFLTYLSLAVPVGYAVVLFMQKKNIALICVSAVNVVLALMPLLERVQASAALPVRVLLISLLPVAAAAELLGLVLLNSLPALQKHAKMTRYLWFIPAAILLIVEVIDLDSTRQLFRMIEYFGIGSVTGLNILFEILLGIFLLAAYLFHGLWLGTTLDPAKKQVQQPRPNAQYHPYAQPQYRPYPPQNNPAPGQQPYMPQNNPAAYSGASRTTTNPRMTGNPYQNHQPQTTYNPYAANSQPAAGGGRTTVNPQTAAKGVEELKAYKELLDSGVITQEEFEAKKKQILGL